MDRNKNVTIFGFIQLIFLLILNYMRTNNKKIQRRFRVNSFLARRREFGRFYTDVSDCNFINSYTSDKILVSFIVSLIAWFLIHRFSGKTFIWIMKLLSIYSSVLKNICFRNELPDPLIRYHQYID